MYLREDSPLEAAVVPEGCAVVVAVVGFVIGFVVGVVEGVVVDVVVGGVGLLSHALSQSVMLYGSSIFIYLSRVHGSGQPARKEE